MMNYQRHAIGINMPQAPQTSYIQPAIQMPSQVPRQKPQRALVGFANVPKFNPPTYEGVLPEDLPCPDTPSPRGSLASSPDDDEKQQPHGYNQTTNNLAEDYNMGVRTESTRNRGNRQQTGIVEARNKQLTPSKDPNVAKKDDANSQQPYPPGSFVEYRSRTMQDRWILAKVEAFDDKNRVYKLDVQPKAPMDRVRLRQSNSTAAGTSGRTADSHPAPEQHNQQHDQQAAEVKSQEQKRKADAVIDNALHEVIDPYEDEKQSLLEQLQHMGEHDLRVRVEQLLTENMQLKQQLDQERQRSANLEGQLRVHMKVDM